MKNRLAAVGMIGVLLAFTLAFTACPTDSGGGGGGGSLTITDVPSGKDGKYVQAIGTVGNTYIHAGAEEPTSSGGMKGVKFSAGTTTLNVYSHTASSPAWDDYSGSDTVTLAFAVFDNESSTGMPAAGSATKSITFDKGKATIKYTDITWNGTAP
jgi:hypothetical protein